jgi:hypothetical protein
VALQSYIFVVHCNRIYTLYWRGILLVLLFLGGIAFFRSMCFLAPKFYPPAFHVKSSLRCGLFVAIGASKIGYRFGWGYVKELCLVIVLFVLYFILSHLLFCKNKNYSFIKKLNSVQFSYIFDYFCLDNAGY